MKGSLHESSTVQAINYGNGAKRAYWSAVLSDSCDRGSVSRIPWNKSAYDGSQTPHKWLKVLRNIHYSREEKGKNM